MFPVAYLPLLLNRTNQEVLLVDRLLLLGHLKPVEVPEIERRYETRTLVVKLTTPMELVILEVAFVGHLSRRVVQLAIPVHEVLIEVTHIIPSRREIQLPLPLFLSLHVDGTHILRFFVFNLLRQNFRCPIVCIVVHERHALRVD